MRVRAFAFHALSPGRRATSNLYLDPHLVRGERASGPCPKARRGARLSPDFRGSRPARRFRARMQLLPARCAHWRVYRRIAAGVSSVSDGAALSARAVPSTDAGSEDLPAATETPQSVRKPHEARAFRKRLCGKRHAILLAGEIDLFHFNDLELSYRTLIGTFNFDPNNIHVLFHDGNEQAGRSSSMTAPPSDSGPGTTPGTR